MEAFDVAIVGYGPVGATLAHLLGACGLDVVVLEREDAAYHLPRAVHFDAEVMRVFQWIGIAREMEPMTRTNLGARFVGPGGELLLEWPRLQGTGPHGWRYSYLFHQPDLETLLRDTLERRRSVRVRTGCDVLVVGERGDQVDIRYRDSARNTVEEISARYVVGCDGARSLVRREMDAGLHDLGFHERWLVVDVVLERDNPELGEFTIQYCLPDRPATYVRGPGLRRRWEIALRPGEDPQETVEPRRAWQLLAPWLSPNDGVLERATIYTFHSVVADCWRRGRLLIAGDAAHQTPPFLGQGLCTGIRDTANLYWKLALLCRDQVTEADAQRLLNSYQSERASHTSEYIAAAMRLGALINTSNPGAALRTASVAADGTPRITSIAPQLGPGLGSVGKVGCLFGQPRLADGRLMDEVYAHRFVVVADAALLAGLQVPAGMAIVTTATSPDAAAHLAQLGVRAAVLRPDRYTLGTADTSLQLTSLLGGVWPDPIISTEIAHP